jgi:hypothetical protein
VCRNQTLYNRNGQIHELKAQKFISVFIKQINHEATRNTFCTSYKQRQSLSLNQNMNKTNTLRKLFLSCLAIALFLPLKAQILARQLEFETETFDFGEITYGSKKVETNFIFTNTSENDFTISNIRPGCNCTSIEYTKGVIKPGQRGVISAKYDPTGHIGDIDKVIYIEGNFKNSIFKIIHIKGLIVHPMAASSPDGFKKYHAGQLGYLRILEPHVSFGLMTRTENRLRTFHIVNDGEKAFKFVELLDKPAFLEYSIDKKTVEPGDTAEIRMVMLGRKISDLGYYGEHFKFLTSDAFYPRKDLGISVEIIQDFSHLSPREIKRGPRAEFDKTIVDLGDMEEGSTKSAVYTVFNKGKSPLEIIKIKTHCSCTVVSGHDTLVPKKGSTQLTITFDSVFKSGSQTKKVTIYTNDPTNPQTELTIHANILNP